MNLTLNLQRSLTLTHSDATLIARCQKADIAAFNEIVARYKGKIYNYLYRMTSNAEDAEDLTQEVFVRMYTNIRTFRAESSLSTWLFRIAGNLCVDSFRRKKKERGVVQSLDAPLPGSDMEDGVGATRDVPDWTSEPDTMFFAQGTGRAYPGRAGEVSAETALRRGPARHRRSGLRRDRADGKSATGNDQVAHLQWAGGASRASAPVSGSVADEKRKDKQAKPMATILDCKAVQPQISEYIDGAMDNADAAWAIKLHLSSCAVCTQVAEDLTQTTRLLQALPGLDTSANFEAALARRLADQVLQPRRPSILDGVREWWSGLPSYRTAFASAAALAAVVPAGLVLAYHAGAVNHHDGRSDQSVHQGSIGPVARRTFQRAHVLRVFGTTGRQFGGNAGNAGGFHRFVGKSVRKSADTLEVDSGNGV